MEFIPLLNFTKFRGTLRLKKPSKYIFYTLSKIEIIIQNLFKIKNGIM